MDFMELLDFACTGTGVPKEINVAVWVGDISLIFSALAHIGLYSKFGTCICSGPTNYRNCMFVIYLYRL